MWNGWGYCGVQFFFVSLQIINYILNIMENRDMSLFDFILLCFKALSKLVKNVAVLFLGLVRLGLQYFWVVFLFAALGLVGGWLWSKKFATTYKGHATIVYAEGMREVVQEGIIDFLMLPRAEKIEYGLSEELLDAFSRLDFYNVIDCNADSVVDYIDEDRRVSLSDTINLVMRDRIHLVLKVKGMDDLTSFEVALKNFFNSQEYIVKSFERCKAVQKDRLDYFTRELARLDSFSVYDYFERPRSLVMMEHKDFIIGSKQSLYYDAMMVVLEHKNHLDMQNMLTPEILNFQTPFVPYFLPPVYKYAIGLLVGGILGMIVVLMIRHREIIVAFLKEK